MTVSLKHAHQSAIPDDGSDVGSNAWNAEHTFTIATAKLVGRSTAGTGDAEEIAIGSGLSLAAGTLSASGGGSGSPGGSNTQVQYNSSGSFGGDSGFTYGGGGVVTIGAGTITASKPTTISQTWNNAAVDFTALKVDVTRTLYGVNSRLFDIVADGVSVGHVDFSGQFNVVNFQVFDGVDVFNSGIMGTFYNAVGERAGLIAYANGTGVAPELQIFTDGAKPLSFGAGSALSWVIDSTNNAFSPTADDTYNIGNASERVKDIHASGNIKGKLTTDTNYTATPIVPTGYLTLYDAAGTAYQVPCVAA